MDIGSVEVADIDTTGWILVLGADVDGIRGPAVEIAFFESIEAATHAANLARGKTVGEVLCWAGAAPDVDAAPDRLIVGATAEFYDGEQTLIDLTTDLY